MSSRPPRRLELAKTPPHPATVAQRRPAPHTPAKRAPHPAKVVQQKAPLWTPPPRPPHPATMIGRAHAAGAVQRSIKPSFIERFNGALGKDIEGERKTVKLNGVKARELRATEGQILFHGTKKSFKQLAEGQIYLSDFNTAASNGEFVMILEISTELELLDLSDESTVEGILLTQDDSELHEALLKTTGLHVDEGKVTGSFRKGTVGRYDNFLCAWTKEGADCDGFVRFPVSKKGFPEIAVHAVEKLRVLGYSKNGKLVEY